MDETHSRGRGRLAALLLGAVACAAGAAGVLTMKVQGPYGAQTAEAAKAPVDTSDITAGIASLKPNCRRIGVRRLKDRLDRADRGALTSSDLGEVLDPLRRGGSDLCDAITGQSFALGGN